MNSQRRSTSISLIFFCVTRVQTIVLLLVMLGTSFYWTSRRTELPIGAASEATKSTAASLSPPISQAVICAVVKSEEYYIDEWVDYNLLGLGFDHIFLFDNSPQNELSTYFSSNNKITVIHFPGEGFQAKAYLTCARDYASSDYTYAAFLDLDEFIVLKKHDNIGDFLREYLPSLPDSMAKEYTKALPREQWPAGAISISWLMMGSHGRNIYQPFPMSYRFRYGEDGLNEHVKTIARLEDMDMTRVPHVHFCYLPNGRTQINTSGKSDSVWQWADRNPQDDVAVIYHFHTKSHKEFIYKRLRGRADVTHGINDLIEEAKAGKKMVNGSVFDDSVWQTLVKGKSSYKMFEEYPLAVKPRYPPRGASLTDGAILCSITENEEAYIDEWVDYHLALGFDEIVLLDSTPSFELQQWGSEKEGVKLYHLQNEDDATTLCMQNHTGKWVALWEVGSMLVLRQHGNIADLLQEYSLTADISIHRQLFQVSDQKVYRPKPFTKRFQYRSVDVSETVGTIYWQEEKQHSRNISVTIPPESAILFTYPLRTSSEYKKYFSSNKDDTEILLNKTEFTMEGWDVMKKYVPWYSLYEAM